LVTPLAQPQNHQTAYVLRKLHRIFSDREQMVSSRNTREKEK
jgi:hypothetical protein